MLVLEQLFELFALILARRPRQRDRLLCGAERRNLAYALLRVGREVGAVPLEDLGKKNRAVCLRLDLTLAESDRCLLRADDDTSRRAG